MAAAENQLVLLDERQQLWWTFKRQGGSIKEPVVMAAARVA